ncbi:hypothetical protein DUNSADRAFT_14355 [Dunaliella salina]|uniref:Uncharacterized protein n=1 Tax=Dunaliella salina TaxID=3046 RepID=A0ABQ7G7G0_DUNSA|nr:hypothetical protein DUNSADRAFT_14355 [Dunaliella salina]|eukprot:KAF5830548.1 hypothetical protein DUNSADRAFT_14355 [Dunaliella salina]
MAFSCTCPWAQQRPATSLVRAGCLERQRSVLCTSHPTQRCRQRREQVSCRGTSSESPSGIDWNARRRKRIMEDLHEACQRRSRLARPPLPPEQNQRYERSRLESGIERLELLLPGFSINIEQLSALQWADIVTDTNSVAAKLVALKGCYPNLDLVDLLQKYPKVLTLEAQELRENASKVRELLQGAPDPEAIIQAVPELITPKILASVLITINKWYQLERDPVEVLQNDPDIVRRAQEVDAPFEPVYDNDDGSWMLPQLAYREKRTDWQKYIDQTRFKQP